MHLRVVFASSPSSWLGGVLRHSASSHWTLSLFYLSLVGTCWSITVSLVWLLPRLPHPPCEWKGTIPPSSCVCPLGSSYMLEHHPPLHPHLSHFPPAWSPLHFSDVTALVESSAHCQGDCMQFKQATMTLRRSRGWGQRSAQSPTPLLGKVMSWCSVFILIIPFQRADSGCPCRPAFPSVQWIPALQGKLQSVSAICSRYPLPPNSSPGTKGSNQASPLQSSADLHHVNCIKVWIMVHLR